MNDENMIDKIDVNIDDLEDLDLHNLNKKLAKEYLNEQLGDIPEEDKQLLVDFFVSNEVDSMIIKLRNIKTIKDHFLKNGIDILDYRRISLRKTDMEYIRNAQNKPADKRTSKQSRMAHYGEKLEEATGKTLEEIYEDGPLKFRAMALMNYDSFKYLMAIRGQAPEELDKVCEPIRDLIARTRGMMSDLDEEPIYPVPEEEINYDDTQKPRIEELENKLSKETMDKFIDEYGEK